MDDWKEYLTEAKAYKKAADGKSGRPNKFNPPIRYNLYAMSLEKSMMAILDHFHDMPDNHTFTDLIEAVDRHYNLPEALVKSVLELEKEQSICSIYDYERKVPTNRTNELMSEVIDQLLDIAKVQCLKNKIPDVMNSQ